MPGAVLAALYAYPPNRHGYCGKKSFAKTLKWYLHGEHDASTVRELEREIKDFRTHYAYLKLIARENDLEPFDLKVVKAFWIGNHLLDNVSADALRRFLGRDLLAGKSKKRIQSLRENLPEAMVPHHSFNSLYVNFVTDKVERKIENYDSCCVTFGRVTIPSVYRPLVSRFSITRAHPNHPGLVLKQKSERLHLEPEDVRLVHERLRPGDPVTVHWGQIVQKIGAHDLHMLFKYTRMNMEAINKSQQGPGSRASV